MAEERRPESWWVRLVLLPVMALAGTVTAAVLWNPLAAPDVAEAFGLAEHATATVTGLEVRTDVMRGAYNCDHWVVEADLADRAVDFRVCQEDAPDLVEGARVDLAVAPVGGEVYPLAQGDPQRFVWIMPAVALVLLVGIWYAVGHLWVVATWRRRHDDGFDVVVRESTGKVIDLEDAAGTTWRVHVNTHKHARGWPPGTSGRLTAMRRSPLRRRPWGPYLLRPASGRPLVVGRYF